MKFIQKNLESIYDKVLNEKRLTFGDGMILANSNDIHSIGLMANLVRERKNRNRAFYIINQHLNYTNVCVNGCKFCAFSKKMDSEETFTISLEDAIFKIKNKIPKNVSEIHIVGGLHPELKIDYFEQLFQMLKSEFPNIHLQAFTAVEIFHIAKISGLSVEDTLKRLLNAGLGSLPGGGAEIFNPEIRKKICPEKISGEEWLNVMRTAHKLRIRSNATMLYGHIETPEDCIDHLIKLRDLQDETGGFMTFIPLLYHPSNTQLSIDNEAANSVSGIRDLKQIAIARLMLDNFDHIKAFWIMLGVKLAQVSLSFGADDFDGTVIEEKITHSAGAATPQALTESEIKSLIIEAGRIPVKRDTLYNILS